MENGRKLSNEVFVYTKMTRLKVVFKKKKKWKKKL